MLGKFIHPFIPHQPQTPLTTGTSRTCSSAKYSLQPWYTLLQGSLPDPSPTTHKCPREGLRYTKDFSKWEYAEIRRSLARGNLSTFIHETKSRFQNWLLWTGNIDWGVAHSNVTYWSGGYLGLLYLGLCSNKGLILPLVKEFRCISLRSQFEHWVLSAALLRLMGLRLSVAISLTLKGGISPAITVVSSLRLHSYL